MHDRLRRDRVPGPVLEVVRTLGEAGHEAWLVGGAVRDLLRTGSGRAAADWDVATSARPEAVKPLFRKVIPTGIAHGTVTVLTRQGPVEVTTFRGEGTYSDARRPDAVVFLDDVEADLARRDFTVNAMAWDPLTGEVRDPFGGLRDLDAGVLRAVRDPIERFTEDGLRPMRAVRFAAVLELALDPATRAAIPQTLDSFRKVAVERIQQELTKLLGARRPSVGLVLMADTGLAAEILPQLVDAAGRLPARAMAAVDAAGTDLEVRLAALCRDAPAEVGSILERLRYPNAVRDAVVRLLGEPGWGAWTGASDVDLRRLLSRTGVASLGRLLTLWRAEAVATFGAEPPEVAALCERLEDLAAGRPPLSPRDLALGGREVMKLLGVSGGPVVGEALAHLLDRVLEEPTRNTRDRLESELTAFAAARGLPAGK